MTSTIVRIPQLKTFIERLMENVGTVPNEAALLADVLINADYRGHYSHGVNRLGMYHEDIKSGITAVKGSPIILKEKGGTALVDGQNLLGPTVSKYSMDLAIEKARQFGIGWVVARGSNHYSIAGHWAMQAEKEGLIGMAFTNTSPLVFPTRGSMTTYGTNPISVAAPASGGDSFVLDMATTAVALGKIEVAHRKGDEMPDGWGAGKDGKMTNNPAECLTNGGLLPLGGSEESGGYKGYGLAMMVELFCGILSGANYSSHIRKWGNTDTVANLGQCFVAIDTESFAPDFKNRLSDLHAIHRGLKSSEDSVGPVMVPGDPERNHMANCDKLGGIPYHINIVNSINQIAESHGIEKLPFEKM